MIERMGLQQSAAVMAGLADGTQVVMETFSCIVDWFGQQQRVEVVENEGQVALLGVGLPRDRRLEIDYRSRTLLWCSKRAAEDVITISMCLVPSRKR
jgi:hypothetical protein